MPVRSINLRLVIPRSPEAASTPQALWTTHAEVNAAARYYEEHLLRLRAESYKMAPLDGQEEIRKVSRDQAQAAAVAIGREAQRINLADPGSATITDRGQDDEILSALQVLYRQIVPAETGAASAQNANAFLSPLTDSLSQGFGAAAEKLGRSPPNWLSIASVGGNIKPHHCCAEANCWPATDRSVSWACRPTGSASTGRSASDAVCNRSHRLERLKLSRMVFGARGSDSFSSLARERTAAARRYGAGRTWVGQLQFVGTRGIGGAMDGRLQLVGTPGPTHAATLLAVSCRCAAPPPLALPPQTALPSMPTV